MTVEEPSPSFIVDADSCFTLHAALRKEMEKINEILEVVQEFKTVMDLWGDAREATTSSRLKAHTAGQNVRLSLSLSLSLCVSLSFGWID